MGDPILGFIVLLLAFFIYFAPFGIAAGKRAKGTLLIGFLNLLLGWTFVIWVVLFVVACCKQRRGAYEVCVDSDEKITARVKLQIREEQIREELLAQLSKSS